MPARKLCQLCRKPIPKDKRANAKFCSDPCKSKAYRQRRRRKKTAETAVSQIDQAPAESAKSNIVRPNQSSQVTAADDKRRTHGRNVFRPKAPTPAHSTYYEIIREIIDN